MVAPQQTNHALAQLVLRQFRMIFNEVKTHFQRSEKVSGLGGAQLWALSLIEQQPGMQVTDLAKAMDIHQSTASNLIRQLVQRSYIRTAKQGADRRTVHLFAEPSGQSVLNNVPGPYAGVLPDALNDLDEETLASLHTDLSTLIQRLRVSEDASQIPLADISKK